MNTDNYFFSLLFFLGILTSIQAQSTDLAQIEYSYFPQSSSDNSFGQFNALLAFPIKLGEKSGYLIPGIAYENVNFQFEDEVQFQKKGGLDRFQTFTFSLAYTFKMQNNWRFAVWNGFLAASNFETGKLIKDDFVYTGAIGFIKDKSKVEKPWRFIFGLYYSTKARRPYPLPVVNYYSRFRPDWSYTLGVPKTNLKYYLNEKSEFQIYARLDGFYANFQEGRHFTNSDKVAESISMTIVLAGLGYEYNFTDHLSFYLYGEYTGYNDFRLRDAEKQEIRQINNINMFHARTGLKFNIL